MPGDLISSISKKIPIVAKIQSTAKYDLAVKSLNLPYKVENNIVAYAKGRMFDTCMLNGRNNGYIINDLIRNPAYILESLIRHEIASEIDLIASNVIISNGTSNNKYEFSGTEGYLANRTLNYYTGAYLYNMTKDWIAPILAYDGQYIEVSLLYSGDIGDKYKIFNIQGDNLVDVQSFDYVGNKTTGVRKDWKFDKSIKDRNNISSIIQSLCYESFTILVKSYNKYKLVPIYNTKTAIDGILNNPLYSNGIPMITVQFTPLDNIYTNYEIEYAYEHGRNEYQNKIIVNNNNAINDFGGNFDDEKIKINNAIINYNINKKYTYQCDWIYDNNTALLFTKKIIDLHTKQRLVVTYTGDIMNHIQYEVGDIVRLNYPSIIPASKNNISQFMIMNKSIDMTKRNGSVILQLVEV